LNTIVLKLLLMSIKLACLYLVAISDTTAYYSVDYCCSEIFYF
jgi:hypothetical protein